jgi:hypothetical protein
MDLIFGVVGIWEVLCVNSGQYWAWVDYILIVAIVGIDGHGWNLF